MSSGMTSTQRYPRTEAIIARLMPVLPLVASTMVLPGAICPDCSASRIMASAGRSLTLPAGFMNSHFPQTVAPPAGLRRPRRTSGVPATSPRASSATRYPELVRRKPLPAPTPPRRLLSCVIESTVASPEATRERGRRSLALRELEGAHGGHRAPDADASPGLGRWRLQGRQGEPARSARHAPARLPRGPFGHLRVRLDVGHLRVVQLETHERPLHLAPHVLHAHHLLAEVAALAPAHGAPLEARRVRVVLPPIVHPVAGQPEADPLCLPRRRLQDA